MSTSNAALAAWVNEVANLTKPDDIHWVNGSEAERDELIRQTLASGELIALNPETHPGSYLHRSDPSDVARTEHLTFICTPTEEEAGHSNNWMAPDEAHAKTRSLFQGAMRRRTMYVIPYVMGPVDSPYAQCGVEITDSRYVVLNMRKMTRMGTPALERIEREGHFIKGLHSLGDLDPDRRFIMHYPQEDLIESVGSGYGGNALLGKKCHALRIASYHAREQGWLAEHMLIVGIENPAGETHYVAAAFPSACGKTNLAMLIPPASQAGYKVHTVGDDIAWMHVGEDGRMWAINPEAGYFGVAPGTGRDTNANAVDMLHKDTIFTNVALTSDGQPWWEGLSKEAPAGLTDWRGHPFSPGNGKAAHPNSRFTVSSHQNPSYDPASEHPGGVPISAIIFGGRRPNLVPLVYQSHDWEHGVYVGASVASETTAAQSGAVGVVRRDPMAMKPFCGYNMADYWAHWLNMGGKSDKLPKIFHVNWFRQDEQHRYMWPGFGENLRVLRWIIDRCEGHGGARETPIGLVPTDGALDLQGLDVDSATMKELLAVDRAGWKSEMNEIGTYLDGFGDHTPAALKAQNRRILNAL
jgi:phosphoenolpyruvate carboxykinase (GTP)